MGVGPMYDYADISGFDKSRWLLLMWTNDQRIRFEYERYTVASVAWEDVVEWAINNTRKAPNYIFSFSAACAVNSLALPEQGSEIHTVILSEVPQGRQKATERLHWRRSFD